MRFVYLVGGSFGQVFKFDLWSIVLIKRTQMNCVAARSWFVKMEIKFECYTTERNIHFVKLVNSF